MAYHDATVEIRKLLKERGWNSRKVSVRGGRLTYSGEVRVTIKDPAVPYHEVEKLAKGFEKIDRDHLSGEILSGGNTYVDVNLSESVVRVLEVRHLEALTAAVAKIDGNSIIDVTENVGVSFGNWGETTEIRLWIDSSPSRMSYYNDEGGLKAAALKIALQDKDQAALVA